MKWKSTIEAVSKALHGISLEEFPDNCMFSVRNSRNNRVLRVVSGKDKDAKFALSTRITYEGVKTDVLSVTITPESVADRTEHLCKIAPLWLRAKHHEACLAIRSANNKFHGLHKIKQIEW